MELHCLDCKVLKVLVTVLEDGIAGVPHRTSKAALAAHLKPELILLLEIARSLFDVYD